MASSCGGPQLGKLAVEAHSRGPRGFIFAHTQARRLTAAKARVKTAAQSPSVGRFQMAWPFDLTVNEGLAFKTLPQLLADIVG
jgi:hypothetical protein